MNTSLSIVLDGYTAELEASIDQLDLLLLRHALNTKIDLTCLDCITQSIQHDQPRFEKLCEIAEAKKHEDDNVCCVCYDREADQPLKCSHKLCLTCYDKLIKCPLCREQYKEPVDENKARVQDLLAELGRIQGIMDESDEWHRRPVDVLITNYHSIDEAEDLMRRAVALHQRFEMTLRNRQYSVKVTNQEDGRFKANCNTLAHAWNLKTFIGDGRCRYCSSGQNNLVIDIPSLFDLMSFLSLPLAIQVRAPY